MGEGTALGIKVRVAVGIMVGAYVGIALGAAVGLADGIAVGLKVGVADGLFVVTVSEVTHLRLPKVPIAQAPPVEYRPPSTIPPAPIAIAADDKILP